MTSYYNEIDPNAAEWLRNLIAAGHIAPGVVDTRDIRDVRPDELRGFTQCHFFAGIGVWSYALRRAGWPDDRPIWTGSCPCQPFSAAGRGAGFADERHLWPAWFWLIDQCRPDAIAGEQVASPAGIRWLDLVQSDLEGIGYACGAVDIPAAGVGAPHLRQRGYFVADVNGGQSGRAGAVQPGGEHGLLAQGGSALREGGSRTRHEHVELAEPDLQRREGLGVQLCELEPRSAVLEVGRRGEAGWMVDPDGPRGPARLSEPAQREAWHARITHDGMRERLGAGQRPTAGAWAVADWLACRDGKLRPVEPGTFPLAHGLAGRVGRLRAYGNAIVADQAEAVIRAFDDVRLAP